MREMVRDPIFTEYLFNKGCFIEDTKEAKHPFEANIALAELFGIRIISAPEKASLSMIRLASKLLGENVPVPFYRGFPESVKKMGWHKLLIDQLYNYYITYDLGIFDEARYSVFEEEIERTVFSEKTEVRSYRIITEQEARIILDEAAADMLRSSRPLSDYQYKLLRSIIDFLGYKVEKCACKDTIVKLIIDTRDAGYASMLKLSDVIRLAEEIQYSMTPDEVKYLTYRNRDRKLVTAVLDHIFTNGNVNTVDCFEKKKQWAGLLHHIHYRPVNDKAAKFLNEMRGRRNGSAYSHFEKAIKNGNIPEAVDVLLQYKGGGALLRNLTYLFSKCTTDKDALYVLDHMQCSNKILLLQLIFNYSFYEPNEPRTFMFVRFNKLRVYCEDPWKASDRRRIPENILQMAKDKLQDMLREAAAGTLSKVYVDPGMKKIALPIQESASMGGVGILPKGSRIAIPQGKKLRAFTYWEKVDDIDLSVQGLLADGTTEEFSWRNMYEKQSDSVAYSGDVTSGFNGGSEYFDIDLDAFRKYYPEIKYLVFCDNVYTNSVFSRCYCTAGYMLRDRIDSGEVFEPKTVKSSFRITCDTREAILFALDLKKNEFIWLNVAEASMRAVAGDDNKNYLRKYMDMTDVLNVYDYAVLLASEIVQSPEEADVVFSDRQLLLRDGAVQIRSSDTEKLIALMN